MTSSSARPGAVATADGSRKIDRAGCSTSPANRRTKASNQAITTIAVIEKSPCAQLRVGISLWRGTHKLEIREATATIPGIYMPTPNGITLDIKKLPELIAALQAANSEAISMGTIVRSKK